MAELVRVAWRKYAQSLEQRPLETKAATAGALAAVSDLLAQKLSGAKELKVRKTLLMALYGLAFSGPSAHFLHQALERCFHSKHDAWTVIKKVVVEQLTYGPLCNILFIAWISHIIEREPWHVFRTKVTHSYPSVQLNGWKVWPLAALVSYGVVPLQFRSLFGNLVAMLWSTFLILQSGKRVGDK